MATNIEIVFESFLSKIADYKFTLTNTTPINIHEELLGYYKSSYFRFVQCPKDLSLTHSNFINLPEDETVSIKGDLNRFEVEILAKLMLVEYLSSKIHTEDLMGQVLNDRDFNINSQANHLQQMQSLRRSATLDVNQDIMKYSWAVQSDVYD